MNATLRLKTAYAALVAAVALSACSGGSSSPVAPLPNNATPGAPSSGTTAATAAVPYGAAVLSGATYVKRATVGSVGLDVIVTMRDAPGLLAYAKEATDPKNALFRHWLTPQELGDRFGASASDYAAATKYFTGNGIAVEGYPQRQILRIHGSQANVERALGLQFGIYKKNGQTFIAPAGAPRPATSLHVAALSNVVRYVAKSRRFLTLRPSTAFVQGYAPEQIAGGFDFTGAYAAGYKGDGVTIGIIGTGAITDGDPRIKLGDVADYRSLFKVAGSGTVKQDVDLDDYSPGDGPGGPTEYSQTGLATPPPVTSPSAPGCPAGNSLSNPLAITDYTTCNPEDLESQLDTEQASALAPDATVEFYIAYNPSECSEPCSTPGSVPSQELGLAEADDEIEGAIADNKSDVISMSFGEDELASEQQGFFGTSGDPSFEPVEFASLVSEGTAVFASSGDNGAEECMDDTPPSPDADQPCTSYPATDPSVISVGGVNAPFDDSGRLTGPMTGWGLATQDVSLAPGGSGGGCSAYFDSPAYETGVSPSLPCSGKRPQPDVALDADTNTGVAADVDADSTLGGRNLFALGGTSVASPEMAAMWALVVQACKASAPCATHGSGSTPYRLGNPGTYLYKIYQNSTQYPATFYDVLFGNNSLPSTGGSGQDPGFNAGKGYDRVTGLGAPFGRNLVSSVLANVP
jgi:subtilase family serine protease